MSRIQKFEEFQRTNESFSERFPKRSFDKFTAPERPEKRNLTKEESTFMYRNFKNHSWSNIDAKGRIILGGGEEEMGKFYITEEDLEKFMEEERSGGYRYVGRKTPY